jgi:REP element-mobilizing transposase RayT
MCRGNARERIFYHDHDRRKFLSLLADSLEMYQVKLHAYTLMCNHFHLLIQTQKANCAEFMRRFNVTYTGWFNNQHNRCGHLFQGRYKSILIDADNYLLEVSRYIHLNSVRTPSFSKAEFQRRWLYVSSYKWASLPGYIDKERMNRSIYYDRILMMIGGRVAYRRFIIDGLKHKVTNPFKDVKYGTLLGDESFVKIIRAECIEEGSKQEQPSYREITIKHISPATVMKCVADVYSVDEHSILGYYGDSEVRGMVSEFLYRYSNMTQSEIGKILGGISYSGISKLRFRLSKKLLHKPTTASKYAEIERRLKDLSIVKI